MYVVPTSSNLYALPPSLLPPIPESRWCSSITSCVSFFNSGSEKYCTSSGRNTYTMHTYYDSFLCAIMHLHVHVHCM